jgi:hypothetical protein
MRPASAKGLTGVGSPALVDNDDGRNDSIAAAENIVAVNLPPLVAVRRVAKMMGLPVDLSAARPVFLLNVVTLLPFLVADVLLMLIVVVVLGEGNAPGEREGEGRDGKGVTERSHEFSSEMGFRRERGCCLKKSRVPGRTGNFAERFGSEH